MKITLFALLGLALISGYIAAVTYTGVGTLTITNQTRICVADSDGILLDPGLQIGFDSNATVSYVRSWDNLSNRNLWRGGNIYVTMDAVPNGNTFDTLTCIPSGLITTSYDATKRTLTLAAGAFNTTTVTYDDIQATLRTLKLQIKGQCVVTRNIRIFVETPGFRFVNSRGGRIYAVAATRIDGDEDATWYEALADTALNPARYGLKQYFASMTSAAENVYLLGLFPTELGGQNWIGARAVNPTANATALANRSPLDATVTGVTTQHWMWADGPDYGTVFWYGGPNTSTGHAVNGAYNYWNTGEPNGDIAGETNNNGASWNDQQIGNAAIQDGGWLVEYGGLPNDANVIRVQVIGSNSLLMANPF